jgi:transposase
LDNQLDDFIKNNPILANNKNILLGDAGYDSNKLRLKLIDIKFGKLVTSKNKRNIKDPIKLLALKLTTVEKALLKKRIKVEHINSHLKQYKRLAIRYDKFSSNFQGFLYLACMDIILKRSGK